MKNINIARMLKYYRALNKLTVPDVANMLEQIGTQVAVKTIYGWESGQTQPDADTLLRLCKLYKIDNILDVFGYSDSTDSTMCLTKFEANLIRSYRRQPDMHSAIHKLLGLQE